MTAPAATLGGKTALVTGAATGIGKAIAADLAAAGARVVINHLRAPELADKAVAEIRAGGGTALAIAADVSNQQECQAMVDRIMPGPSPYAPARLRVLRSPREQGESLLGSGTSER